MRSIASLRSASTCASSSSSVLISSPMSDMCACSAWPSARFPSRISAPICFEPVLRSARRSSTCARIARLRSSSASACATGASAAASASMAANTASRFSRIILMSSIVPPNLSNASASAATPQKMRRKDNTLKAKRPSQRQPKLRANQGRGALVVPPCFRRGFTAAASRSRRSVDGNLQPANGGKSAAHTAKWVPGRGSGVDFDAVTRCLAPPGSSLKGERTSTCLRQRLLISAGV